MAAEAPERVKLTDEERKRVRWSSTKTGYVGRIEFAPRYGRRGARPVRPVRTQLSIVRQPVEEELLAATFRFRDPVRRLVLRKVDHLGRVLESEELS